MKWREGRSSRRCEREGLAAEGAPSSDDDSTGAIVFEESCTEDLELRLIAGRWSARGLRGAPALLVVEQDDFVFQCHWCVYEVEEPRPLLAAAVPVSAVRTIQDPLLDAVQPRTGLRRGAVDYPWKPVPAYVTRTLGATAAWVGGRGRGWL